MCGCNSLPGKCCCTSGGSAGALCECTNLELEDSILHTGNHCTYIGFDTNQITIDACGPTIVLDNALPNKITHTGQTQFVDNVGVGTATPAYPLVVNGSAKVTTLRDTSNSVGTAGQLLSSTGSALQWVAAPTPVVPAAPVNSVQFNNAGAFGGDSDFTFDASTNTVSVPDIILSNYVTHIADADCRIGFPANDQIALRTAGIDRVFVGATGNVGISTTTPAYPLDVNGSAKVTTIRDTANSVGTAGQVLSSTGSALQWVAAGGSLPMAVIRETKAVNVASGVVWPVTTTPVIRPRQWDAKTEAGLTVTLGGSPNWTFTLSVAGTFLFEAIAYWTIPSSDGQTVTSRLVLNNQTLGLGSVILGDSNNFGPISAINLTNTNWTCHLNGIYTITGTTVFSLDHVLVCPFFGVTGGKPSNISGYSEVYATLRITKLS